MLTEILNRVLFFFLFFALLIIAKEVLLFIIAYKKQSKLNLNTKREIELMTAISYVFTFIFTGLF